MSKIIAITLKGIFLELGKGKRAVVDIYAANYSKIYTFSGSHGTPFFAIK